MVCGQTGSVQPPDLQTTKASASILFSTTSKFWFHYDIMGATICLTHSFKSPEPYKHPNLWRTGAGIPPKSNPSELFANRLPSPD